MYAGTNQVASNACFHFFLPYLCLQLIDALTKCNFKQQSLFCRLKTKKNVDIYSKSWKSRYRITRHDYIYNCQILENSIILIQG